MSTLYSDLFPETLLVSAEHGASFTTSLKVAEHFGKNHFHVLRAVENLMSELAESGSAEAVDASTFGCIAPPFRIADYLDDRSRRKPMYCMSRDGFSLLAMGFTGKAALAWKVKFLASFNLMEAQLRAHTEAEARALHTLRPRWQIVLDGTRADQRRVQIAELAGWRSTATVTTNRARLRALGLLPRKVQA